MILEEMWERERVYFRHLSFEREECKGSLVREAKGKGCWLFSGRKGWWPSFMLLIASGKNHFVGLGCRSRTACGLGYTTEPGGGEKWQYAWDAI